jgi:hypothetical protein
MPTRNAADAPSRQVMLRMPTDLATALDRFCRDRRTRRSAVIVAALRAHLGKPAPAEIPAERSPT